ncbi:hypothetical protein KOW79_007315 [Hemibagrus wyckioides]|uniref:Urotensin-related peptide 1 n=1 Tax=Hemibagrus wyckioides TaxID=337641 RepID=A0A9D3NTJ2_9TELE|nr:hypothetical protein KOW79_007315 [Hemibagrus wyckioides]
MSDIDPSRIDGPGRYKTKVPSYSQETETQVVQDSVTMLSVALLYILAVVFPAVNALPLYSDTALTPHEDFLQKLVTEIEDDQSNDVSAQRDVKTILPILLHHERDRDSWPKGEKENLQQDKMNHMVDDLKEVVRKLAAADNLRSQGFLRSEQNLPKPNKRACFWKYCVTN